MKNETQSVTQVTKEQAIALYEGKFYEGLTSREIAEFQLSQDRLCMPFDVFCKAMNECLGRGVYTHEYASSNRDNLHKEFYGEKEPPTFEQILNLIPAGKRIVIHL